MKKLLQLYQNTNLIFKPLIALLQLIDLCFGIKRISVAILLLLIIAPFSAFSQQQQGVALPVTTDSRIRTLVYNANEVYELKFHYGYQAFIEFADDEEIEMISIGESFAWRITPAGKRLFIRPLEIAAHTNMAIITNKRTYHFDIRSGEYNGEADEELVYVIRFFYPQIGQPIPIPPKLTQPNLPQVAKISTPTGKAMVNQPLPGIMQANPDNLPLNFDYSIAGSAKNIMPLKVYDNSIETLMQFPNDNMTIPTISAVDAFGVEIPMNYIIRDNYVVIPTIERQFTLRLADSLLCIYNNKAISGGR